MSELILDKNPFNDFRDLIEKGTKLKSELFFENKKNIRNCEEINNFAALVLKKIQAVDFIPRIYNPQKYNLGSMIIEDKGNKSEQILHTFFNYKIPQQSFNYVLHTGYKNINNNPSQRYFFFNLALLTPEWDRNWTSTAAEYSIFTVWADELNFWNACNDLVQRFQNGLDQIQDQFLFKATEQARKESISCVMQQFNLQMKKITKIQQIDSQIFSVEFELGRNAKFRLNFGSQNKEIWLQLQTGLLDTNKQYATLMNLTFTREKTNSFIPF